jgi:hypothetical protein
MCGLTGYSGKADFSLPIMELIIAWNSLERGSDATGLYSPSNGLKKTLEKGSHYVIYENKEYFTPDKIFIGHVRHATVGDKSKVENAHPFHRSNYVLAHNGTLKNYKDLLFKYEIPEEGYNVDSDCIAGCIAASKNIAQVLSEIDGAGAFLIHDTEQPNKLYIFRNSERPLYRGYDEDNNMYISSIPEPLYYFQLKNIKEFKENILYTIIDGAIVANKCQKIKNTPYKKPYVVNHKQWEDVIDSYPPPPRNACPTNNVGFLQDRNTTKDRYKPRELDLFNNLWVRSRMNVSYYCSSQGERVELKKDEYYLVTATSTDDDKCWVQLESSFVEIHKSYFVEADIIKNYDVVMLMEDRVFNKKGSFIGNKGDIFQVNYMYPDGDISLRPYNHLTAATTNYLTKDSVRKLTAEELTLFINTIKVNAEPTITPVEETKTFVRGNEIMVNEDKLINFFSRLKDSLEDIKDLTSGSFLNFNMHEELKTASEIVLSYVEDQKKILLSTNNIKM